MVLVALGHGLHQSIQSRLVSYSEIFDTARYSTRQHAIVERNGIWNPVQNVCDRYLWLFLQDEETQEKLYTENIREDNVGNFLSFDEAQNLIKKGFKTKIEHDDLWRLEDDSRANVLYNKFYPGWKRELEKPQYVPRSFCYFV